MKYRAKQEIKNDPLTEKIIGACFKVHKSLWPGFNEKIYGNALKIALGNISLTCDMEKSYVVTYEERCIGSLRTDFVVEGKVIIEIKAVSGVMPKVFEHQILSYLKITGFKIGLLVNFGEKSCQIKRFVY